MNKVQEGYANEDYMKKWVEITDHDAKMRKEKEEKHKQKLLEVKEYQLK